MSAPEEPRDPDRARLRAVGHRDAILAALDAMQYDERQVLVAELRERASEEALRRDLDAQTGEARRVRAILRFPCTYCGAAPGNFCTTASRHARWQPHKQRERLADLLSGDDDEQSNR